jgi:hypothetical protein
LVNSFLRRLAISVLSFIPTRMSAPTP